MTGELQRIIDRTSDKLNYYEGLLTAAKQNPFTGKAELVLKLVVDDLKSLIFSLERLRDSGGYPRV